MPENYNHNGCNIYNNTIYTTGDGRFEKSNIINNYARFDNDGLIGLNQFNSSNIWNMNILESKQMQPFTQPTLQTISAPPKKPL